MNQQLYFFQNLAARLVVLQQKLENTPQSQPHFRLQDPVDAITANSFILQQQHAA